MSHDNHGTHHTTDARPTASFRSAIWLVIIIAGLFIAAVNFVNVMSHDSGEGHGGGHHATEATTGHEAATHEEHAAPAAEAAPATADSTHHEAAH